MENTRVTEEQKKQIMELKGQGVPVPEIARRLGLSESGTYRVIQRERIMNKNVIDDSQEVQRLKKENESLKEQMRLLQKVIEKLLEK